MSDNQKIIVFSIIICGVLGLWVGFIQSKDNHGINYNYYVVTDTVEENNNIIEGYKISNKDYSLTNNKYVKLGLSALIDYNLNIKTSSPYSSSAFFGNYEVNDLSSELIVTTAINTLYKSGLLIQTTEEESGNEGADYKVSSISVDKAIKVLFGDVEYDKKIMTDEIFYNEEIDVYYYKINRENSSFGDNHIEAKVNEIKEYTNTIDVIISIAYINYKDNKVYKEAGDIHTILEEFNKDDLFKNIELYPKYKLTFIKLDDEKCNFKSIEEVQ